jgi:signal transduction histidine kinase
MAELNAELEARNHDLDAFARAVAHDLKNPLATIIGMADVLRDDPHIASAEETRDFVQAILQSGERAAEIIDGLLLLHGIQHETPVLELVDTGDAVDSALETMTQAIAENDAVVTRSGAFLPVRAHGPWLTQVWINLIGNAIKYGGSPPTVDLAAKATSNGMVRFEVKDNGGGIPPDDQDRIFREFERGGSTNVEGHGLGLAIVDRVVSRLDGDTGVDDGEEGGSVFWFTVPAA